MTLISTIWLEFGVLKGLDVYLAMLSFCKSFNCTAITYKSLN